MSLRFEKNLMNNSENWTLTILSLFSGVVEKQIELLSNLSIHFERGCVFNESWIAVPAKHILVVDVNQLEVKYIPYPNGNTTF